MSEQYQVLARKWRPQQFDDVVGQEHVTTTLVNAIEQNRLAHAYLFVGPRGIGKTSTARIFAKAINCVKGPTAKPCDKCDNCKEIIAGTSLDVVEIDGASNNSVSEVRELRETVQYMPARGRYKIYIIDEVHMLTNQAFNALLKTLEEPPPHVKFIFATTEVQKILPTILSRCQRFDLRRISTAAIAGHLRKIAKSEKITIEERALAAIARSAEGGLRDAESGLDQLIAFCGDKITEADVLGVYGLIAHDRMAKLTDAIVDGDTNTALNIVHELDHAGKDLQRLLADLLDHFRNLMILTLGVAAAQSVEVAETEMEVLSVQAKRLDTDAALRIIETLAAAENRLRYTLSKRVYLEIALVKAIQAREMTGIDAVLQKLNELKRSIGSVPAVEASVPARLNESLRPVSYSAPVRSAPPSGAIAPEEAWQIAVEHLGKLAPMARTYLVNTKPVGLRGNMFVVEFDAEFASHRELADTPRNHEVLQNKLRELMRKDVGLKFEVGEVEPKATAARPNPQRTVVSAPEAAPESKPPPPPPGQISLEEFRNDPLIKKALEIFKGTIVDVRT
jgi:DNA polymerase-3 subunit gamma/tau